MSTREADTSPVLVMRRPVLPEDKGMHFPIQQFDMRSEAQTWINKQKDEFFKPGDYYVVPIPRP